MKRRDHSILWALLLIGAGVLLLLRNSGAIPGDVRVWPLVVMVIGVWLLAERLFFGGRWGGGFVWPLVLVAAGGVLFLQDLGVFPEKLELWPVVLIAIGAGIVLSAIPLFAGPRASVVSETVPLEGAASARVEIDHGAGRLTVRSTLQAGTLLEGTFVGGVGRTVRRDGDRVEVTLRASPGGWLGSALPRKARGAVPFDWTLGLTRRIPLSLLLRTGANQASLDLADLRVDDLSVETGAGRTEVTLPSTGRTQARIRGGAAKLSVKVPVRVAARIVVRGGASSVRVDEQRFPSSEGGYRSRDYETAENRADLTFDVGAADIEVH